VPAEGALLPVVTFVATPRLKLPPLTKRTLAVMAIVLLIPILALAIGRVTAVHPLVTREQAIKAAMVYGGRQPYPRVEAKYMRYSDFLKGDTEFGMGRDGSDYFVWVVAVSGEYGISPSGPCCYFPPPATWGIAVVKDEFGPAKATMFESGNKGNWPAFFDGLPDLAKDKK
jgi:hypothetical protein